MKILSVATLTALALGLSGCASPKLMSAPPTAPVLHYGAYVQGPAPAALSFYAGPVDIGPAEIAQPSKRGEACAHNILGFVAFGDASIDAAKHNGGITRVASVEQNPARILSYYAKYCTIVRGE